MKEDFVYKQVIGIILRFFLTALAGYLVKVGVTEEMQKSLVDEAVNYGVPLILLGLAFLWSYAQKRYANAMIQVAKESTAGVSLEKVATEVDKNITVGTKI